MAQQGQQLLRNLVSLVSGFFVVRVVSFLSTLYITRSLGPSEFGTFSFGLTLSFIFIVCTNLGLDEYVVREVAREPRGASGLISDALLLRVIALGIGMLTIVGLSLLTPERAWLLLFLGVYSVMHSCLLLICSVFRGIERMEFQSFLLTGEILLIAVGAALAVYLAQSGTAVAVGYLVAAAPMLGIGYGLLLRQEIRPRYRWQPDVWLRLARITLPFALNSIGLVVFDRLAVVFITVLDGETAAGWFNAVYFIMLVLTSIPGIVVMALFPPLVRAAQQGPTAVAELFAPLVKYTLIASVAATFGLYTLADWIVPLLFGPRYAPSVDILQLLSLGLPLTALAILAVGVLEAIDRQRASAIAIGCALLVAAPMYLAATWRWGYLGGTVTYVVTQIGLVVLLLWLLSRSIGWGRIPQIVAQVSLGGLALALVAALGQSWNLLLLLAVAAVGYALTLVLSGALGMHDLALARSVYSGRLGRRARPNTPPPYPPQSRR